MDLERLDLVTPVLAHEIEGQVGVTFQEQAYLVEHRRRVFRRLESQLRQLCLRNNDGSSPDNSIHMCDRCQTGERCYARGVKAPMSEVVRTPETVDIRYRARHVTLSVRDFLRSVRTAGQ